MAIDKTKLFVGQESYVYVCDLASSVPIIPTTEFAALPASLLNVGIVDRDGITFGLDEDQETLAAAHTPYPVRRWITGRSTTLSFTLHQLDIVTWPFAFNAKVTPGARRVWTATTPYTLGQTIEPVVSNGRYYKCTQAGTSGGTAPTFPTTMGLMVADGTIMWTDMGLGSAVTNKVEPETFSAIKEYAMVIDSIDGVNKLRLVVPRVMRSEGVELNLAAEEAAGVEVTVEALQDDTSTNPWYLYSTF